MKKITLALLSVVMVVNAAIPQTSVGETLNWMSTMASQINNVMTTFKNSTRYIKVAEETQKVYNLMNAVNNKYRSIRSMSNYVNERNFVSFYNEGMDVVENHTKSSQDYSRMIDAGLQIGEKLLSIIQGGASVTDAVSSAVDIGSIIGSGGLAGLGSLFGGSKSQEKPDPQKILDNLKMNDDLLDKCYRELQDATSVLARLNDELDTFQNFDNHEKTIRENSVFYVF